MRHRPQVSIALALALSVPLVATPDPAAAQLEVISDVPRQTTFVLMSPVGLGEVGDALGLAGAHPIDFLHTGPSEGGHHGEGQPLAVAVDTYQADYNLFHEGEPQIYSFTVDGDVPASSLGALGDVVAERHVIDATMGGEGDDAATSFESDVAVANDAPLFVPKFGRTITANRGSDRRGIKQEMTWESQESIDAFGENAYEHDMKLFNRDNLGLLRPLCFPGQSDNFWATRGGLTFVTNYTPEQKPYFDTDVSDTCQSLDLTIGLYHPDELVPGRQYETSIITDAGDSDTSPFTLVAESLPKSCDFNPFCVGTLSSGAERDLLIGETRGVAPGCRAWDKSEEFSSPC